MKAKHRAAKISLCQIEYRIILTVGSAGRNRVNSPHPGFSRLRERFANHEIYAPRVLSCGCRHRTNQLRYLVFVLERSLKVALYHGVDYESDHRLANRLRICCSRWPHYHDVVVADSARKQI